MLARSSIPAYWAVLVAAGVFCTLAARGEDLLWDTGAPHKVHYNGQAIYLGFSSGNLPDKPQRWAAIPFRIPASGAVVTRIDVDWFISPGYEAATVEYIIWQRTGLVPPQAGDEVSMGVLGPYSAGQDDPRVPDVDDWLHSYPGLNIALAGGDYYLTIYAAGIGPGNTTGFSDAPWLTGGDLQDESLERPFMWRSAAFPTPGFEPYDNPAIQPLPGQDPDDRWNPSFALWGTTGGQNEPPQILVHPQWARVAAGQSTAFSVIAGGTEPLGYQWYRNGDLLTGSAGPAHVVVNAGEADVGSYWCHVYNQYGSAVSWDAGLDVYKGLPPIGADPGCCWIPDIWMHDPVPWSRDVSGPGGGGSWNKIDDLIDADPNSRHDVVVDFRVCIEDGHVAMLEALGPVSYVQHRFCVITSVAMADVSYDELVLLVTDPEVAMVEKQISFSGQLDVSLPTIRVTGPAPSLEAHPFYTGIRGYGSNIVIMDSGVDDPGGPGATHAGLPQARGGYDAFGNLFTNPDDENGHGTAVAGVALGRGVAGGVSRGVAPAAGLIDIKVLDQNLSGDTLRIMRALEILLENWRVWNAHVLNMSFQAEEASNGAESFSQLTLRVSGVLEVVVSAGNDDQPGPNSIAYPPANVPGVITVAASDDRGDLDRMNDVLWDRSARGPSEPFMLTQLKPEVAAPGVAIATTAYNSASGIVEATGTSVAAPHVAGILALLQQVRSGLGGGSVADGLRRTSEQRGTPAAPWLDPLWNNGWGWGLVDAYALIDALYTWQPADLTFVETPNDQQRPWLYRYMSFQYPPRAGEPNIIYARIRNLGPGRANDVRVDFDVMIYAGSVGIWSRLGTAMIPAIEAGQIETASMPWTPNANTSSRWQCVKVSIGYLNDPVQSNNIAQHNIRLAGGDDWPDWNPRGGSRGAPSPLATTFWVQNLYQPGPLTISFVVDYDDPPAGWGVTLTPSSVTLAADDLPVVVEAMPVPPANALHGDTETIHIAAVAGGQLLGGVSIFAIMQDCNGNGVHDWLDIRDGTSLDLNGDGIPDECLTGDLDCDGDVDFDDINPFVLALSDPVAYQAVYPDCYILNGDCDGDGDVDFDDINAFVALLSGT